MRDFAALLKAAGNLNQDEITRAFDQFSPAIYRYTLRLSRDTAVADKLTGEVFAQLLEQFSRGKPPSGNLRSYLYQTAYHLIIDRSRDSQRTAPSEVTLHNYAVEESALTQSQTEERMMVDTLIAVMNAQLTNDQRHVIILRFMEDFSLKETAEIMGREVNATKVIQNRAIAKLRKAMGLEIGDDLDKWLEASASALPGTQTTDAPPPEGKKKKRTGK